MGQFFDKRANLRAALGVGALIVLALGFGFGFFGTLIAAPAAIGLFALQRRL